MDERLNANLQGDPKHDNRQTEVGAWCIILAHGKNLDGTNRQSSQRSPSGAA